jgi:hypothetical protein
MIPASTHNIPRCVFLVVAFVDLYFETISSRLASKKHRAGLGAIRQDVCLVVAGARLTIDAAVDVSAVIHVIHFTTIFASEVVILITIVAQSYIIGVDGDVARAEKSAAMATSVIVIGALSAYESVIVIHRYYVYIGH